jgi:hypothetical protein
MSPRHCGGFLLAEPDLAHPRYGPFCRYSCPREAQKTKLQ